MTQQQPPQWGTPQDQQPQWTPPPQQPMGWGGPGYGGAPVRPTSVTLVAIFLILMGILQALAGAACTFAATQFLGTGNSAVTASAGFFSLLFLGVLIVGVASVAAGAGALSGASWARMTGIVVSVIAIVLYAVQIFLFMQAGFSITSQIGSIFVMVLYVLTVYVLVSASAWFARR